MDPVAAKKGCGTCKKRRVRCDRIAPSCSQCSRLKIKCEGYGFHLSWPSEDDVRRCIVRRAQFCTGDSQWPVPGDLVQVSVWDFQMHDYLTNQRQGPSIRPTLHIPMPWNPSELQLGDDDLLQYFCSDASLSLTTFGHEPKNMGRTLMRIALAGNSPSAAAVFQGLLALSSLHRYGVQSQAFRLKIATIKALNAASANNLDAKEVIQRAAAGMLLCSFEVHQASCTSSQWTWYITGVKGILNSSCLESFSQDGDLVALMDWVHYHDVMSRFTLRHWQGSLATDLARKQDSATICVPTEVINKNFALRRGPSSPPSTLELLAELSETVIARPQSLIPPREFSDYKGYLQILEWRIRSISIPRQTGSVCDDKERDIAELYKISTLIYLNRVCSDLLGQYNRVQFDIDRAFTLISQLESCERQYPLLIIGCEARSDERRLKVLGLIARTEKKKSARSLNHLKLLIKALWAQDDLADGTIDYWNKLSSVISSCSILPSLV